MSKQDRAAKAIKFGAARGYSPEQIATLLNELNLLAPDTPQPFFERGRGPNWEIPINDQGGGVATVRTLVGDVFIERHGHGFITNPEEARKISAALLAAANYSEEA